MGSMESEEVLKLREQIRSLTNEVSTLKQKLSYGSSETSSKDVFTWKITLPVTEAGKIPLAVAPQKMCGLEVKPCHEIRQTSAGTSVLHVWFEVLSSTNHTAFIATRITYRADSLTKCLEDEHTRFDMLHVGNGTARTASIPAMRLVGLQASGHIVTFNVFVKLIRTVREIVDPFADADGMAKIKVEEEIIPVNIAYISAWSEFFRGYFASKMKESVEEVFPIEDCTSADFRELLDVISPNCKPITQWNVENLLHLADRFIIPSLSRNCEVFLSHRTKHTFTDAELLKFSDDYRLPFMQAAILEGTTADQLQKNVIAKDEYKFYSEELKKAIDTRYVESKVPERNKC